MRYRKLDPNGDYTFGGGSADFLINSPACVAQAIITGLLLWQGEWFLDTSVGMPWATDVLGYDTQTVYDQAVKNQILSTTGVTAINSYSSTFNPATRSLTITVDVQTAYGDTGIATSLSFAPPLSGGYGVGGYGVNGYGG